MDYHKTAILGIGNILRRDDGVGIHAINHLKGIGLPSEIMLLDGGTAGFDLLHYLQGIKKLIVIDAMLTDEKPGTIHILAPEEIKIGNNSGLPTHHTGLMETIEMASLLWGKIETVIIGIVPKDYLNYGMELTPEVSNAFEHVVDIVKREVYRLNTLPASS
ncbi:MAG: hydrogenase maturation protease [Thermodesulfovibrionales bacterium]|nr:hydrogenase maturation protease [Thermodesulfovibrionales bacterium]